MHAYVGGESVRERENHQGGDRQRLTLGGYLNSIILSSLEQNREVI